MRSATIAITRDVSRSLADCELSFVGRGPIDIDLAIAQHHAYLQALRALGCLVIALPAQETMPDAVFVEDVALVLDEVAVMTRPGAPSRRGEAASVEAVLAGHRRITHINAPGTIDGGDILRLGRAIFVGQSARSNADGIAQLHALLVPLGYSVQGVPTRECLHLKSAVTQVAPDTLLMQPAWLAPEVFTDGIFARYRVIEVDPGEEHAANALRIGDGASVIHPTCFPRTQQRLRDAGIAVTGVDVSELQKAEGAVTCCSLVFNAAAM